MWIFLCINPSGDFFDLSPLFSSGILFFTPSFAVRHFLTLAVIHTIHSIHRRSFAGSAVQVAVCFLGEPCYNKKQAGNVLDM